MSEEHGIDYGPETHQGFSDRGTSRKIRAVHKYKGEKGILLTVHVPYGYVKGPNGPHRWIIGPEAAHWWSKGSLPRA